MTSKTVGVFIEPRMMVTVERACDDKTTLLNAIDTVRKMKPDQLKKLVIDGLVNANSYPFDYAEY